jgi:putative tricarboxylic transport membrane protein
MPICLPRWVEMKKHQILGAGFLLFFGAVICWEARKLDMGRIVKPGPGFFPFWLGFFLIIVAAVLLLRYGRMSPKEPAPALWKGRQWDKIVYVLGALFLYAFFLEFLGYLLATFFLMSFLFRSVEKQKWSVVILGSIISSLITFLLFKVWLQVQLPMGLWGI